MADSLKFTIGGQVGSSYRGALSQAEAEAVASANRIKTAVVASNVAQGASIRMNTIAMREFIVIFREIAAGRGVGRIAASVTLLLQSLWGGFLDVLFSIPGAVAAAGTAIAYFTFKHLKELNAALDKTSELMAKGFGDRLKANYEALKESALAAQDFEAWLRKLGTTEEELVDKTNQSIEALKQQFELMRQIASSEDKVDERLAEQVERRKELTLIQTNLDQQRSQAEGSRESAIEAESLAYKDKDAIARLEKMKDLPSILSEAESNVKKYTAIINELRPQVEADIARNYQPSYDISGHPMTARNELEYNMARTAAIHRLYVTKAGGGESFSAAQAAGQLEKNEALLKSNRQLDIELEETQRQLVDALKNAKSKAEKDNAAVERLTKQRDDLSNAIELHNRLDPIASAGDIFEKSLKGKPKPEQERMLREEIQKHLKNAEFYRSVGDPSADLSAEGESLLAARLQKQLTELLALPNKLVGKVPDSEMERSGIFSSSNVVRVHTLLEQSINVQKHIERNTARMANSHRGGVSFE